MKDDYKVVFINRYYCPDQSATSQILTDLCNELAAHGHDVEVICSNQRIDDPQARLPAAEVLGGVRIHRVWTSCFGRERLGGRLLDYLTFYLSAAACLWRLLRAGDVVVAKTDPPLISVIVTPIAWVRRAAVVNWLQDLFPEVAVQTHVRFLAGPVGGVLTAFRNWSLRQAVTNVAIGQKMSDLLDGQQIPQHSIRVLPNWAKGSEIYPVAPSENELRREWGLEGKFVAGYSGNMGRVHDLATILDAARLLKDNERIAFLLVGSGHQAAVLKERSSREGLKNVVFKPPQPREKLRFSLGVPDIHFVSLKPEMEGLIVPSKFYGVAAAGRPTLFIGAGDGEIARVLARVDCGVTVAPGDARELAATLERLSRQQDDVERLGSNARQVFEREFDISLRYSQWAELLDEASRQMVSDSNRSVERTGS